MEFHFEPHFKMAKERNTKTNEDPKPPRKCVKGKGKYSHARAL